MSIINVDIPSISNNLISIFFSDVFIFQVKCRVIEYSNLTNSNYFFLQLLCQLICCIALLKLIFSFTSNLTSFQSSDFLQGIFQFFCGACQRCLIYLQSQMNKYSMQILFQEKFWRSIHSFITNIFTFFCILWVLFSLVVLTVITVTQQENSNKTS